MTGRRRRRTRAAGLLAVALALGSPACAPHRVPPPELSAGDRAQRYRDALATREAGGAALETDLSLWARTAARGALPGVRADLALAAPDRVHLRVGSLFGTTFEFGAHGDSLVAYVPSRRAALSVAEAGESLGIRRPGALLYRVWSAAWRPPAEAWAAAEWSESLLTVRWSEAEDSLEIGVGRWGLPLYATLSRAGGSRLRADYHEWGRSRTRAWPARIELEDGARTVHVTCRMGRPRRIGRVDPIRLAVRPPPAAALLTWSDLKRALGRFGAF